MKSRSQNEGDPKESAPAGEAVATRRVRCSQSQKRFWFEEQIQPGNPALNVAVRWRLEGEVSHAHITEAWRLLVARHETLRTYFENHQGEPLQVIEPSVSLHIPIVDLTALAEREAFQEADRIALLEAHKTFDVSRAPLLRVTHVRVRERVSVLLVTAHHTVCDGWSVGVLARELGLICVDLQAGRVPSLAPLEATYADFAEWEQDWLADPSALAVERETLKQRLDNLPQFEILTDKRRPPIQTTNSEIATQLLERDLTDSVAALARSHGCTLFMTAFAALLVLLHRYSGEDDILVGTQIAGRDDSAFEDLVGTFVNTVPLRTDVSGNPSFTELLERTRDTVTDAFELRHVPLEQIIEIVNPKRDFSRNILFSVNFIFQRSFIKNDTYGSFKLVDMPSRSAGPIYDLNFFMVERPEGWRASCEYNSDLFERPTVDAMIARFAALLQRLSADPAQRISDVPMMSDEEREQVLALGRGPRSAYERDATVPQLFARQAEQTPFAAALVETSGSVTYAELDERSNRFARYLRDRGVARGTPVAVALERSARVPFALIGILKAGGIYVPLDPAYPERRLQFILADAGVRVVVSEGPSAQRFGGADVTLIDLERDAGAIAAQSAEALDVGLGAESPAYVMYTSGSTGEPKGTTIPHRAIVRLVRKTNYIEFMPSDTVLSYAPLAFDASTFEVWGPLLNGARLAIPPPGLQTMEELASTIDRFGITLLWLTAALFTRFVDSPEARPRSLRCVLTGGDVTSPLHAKRFLDAFPACRLLNGYGPTENTTFSTTHAICEQDFEMSSIPIGRPIANSSAYVLDARLNPTPVGVPGELCVGGDGVALGYLNRPALAAPSFIADPFSSERTARLYRTGDRVRFRSSGVLEFLGRSDEQVKIRGYRVELGEIEAALASHPDIEQSVAVVGRDASGDKVVWAYAVPRSGLANVEESELRKWLESRLPAFMQPSQIVVLTELPQTENGKVDRRALPAPSRDAVPSSGESYRTETEAKVAGLFSELLPQANIGREEDVFSFGFHSLLALRFVARVEQTFGVKLELRTLFERATIASIAEYVDALAAPARSSPDEIPILTLNRGGPAAPARLYARRSFCERHILP